MALLYELLERPELDSPVLLVALKGWVDAGNGAEGALDVACTDLGMRTVARFDPDRLLDWRARRPVMRLVDGILTELNWDTTELSWGHDRAGNGLLVLAGDEPDQSWLAFTSQVVDLVIDLGVRMMVGLGAYPAPAPHTRDPLLACSASSEELAGQGFVRANIEVPTGIQGMLERELARRGVPAIGLWAQVPHYVAAMPYPAASLALLEGANRVAGLALPTGNLAEHAKRTRARIDELLAQNPEHLGMLRQLEEQADQISTAVQLQATSGDQLAAELERFLREQGD
jgi:predicted ATP-grasp superfamily ATP-dependent carboligase